MSVCSNSNCQSAQNIWKISSDNTSPPFYKSFDICNHHLEEGGRFKEMHRALALGRFNKQYGNTVSHNGWTLEKNTATWKKLNNVKCSKCDRTDKIWRHTKKEWIPILFRYVPMAADMDDCEPADEGEGYYKWSIEYLCNEHLHSKGDLCGNFHNSDIFPHEVTWIEDGEPKEFSLKKKKIE